MGFGFVEASGVNSMNCTPNTLRHHAPGGLSPLAVSSAAGGESAGGYAAAARRDGRRHGMGWVAAKEAQWGTVASEGASRGDGEPRAAGERATKGRYRTQCRLLCVVAECELRRRLTISGPVAPSAE